jgi:hypothetical protein
MTSRRLDAEESAASRAAATKPGELLPGRGSQQHATILDLHRIIGNRAVSRALTRMAPLAAQEPAPAKQAPTPLEDYPHRTFIETQTGLSMPGRAVVDPAGAAAMGVPAFTRDQVTHFASPRPPLRVAAHEAAHLYQHAGATRDAGLGAERHADAVARAVTGGHSARPLLGSMGAPISKGVHAYTEFTAQQQKDGKSLGWGKGGGANASITVADDGTMAVWKQTAGVGTYGTTQIAYAKEAMIDKSDQVLGAQDSKVGMMKLAEKMEGHPPNDHNAAKITLYRIDAFEDATNNELELGADCGRTMHEVTGSEQHNRQASAVMRDQAGRETYTQARGYYGNVGPGNVAQRNVVEDWTEEIMRKQYGFDAAVAGLTTKQLYQRYAHDLDPGWRDRFAAWRAGGAQERLFDQSVTAAKNMAKDMGLDEYAVPAVGQGVTTMRDDLRPGWQKLRANTWNFHFGTNIMASGGDWLALENYAGHGAKNWFFWMYGPANKHQTWHETQMSHGEFGNFGRTMVVSGEHTRKGQVANDNVDLMKINAAGKVGALAKGDHVDVFAKSGGWLEVTVVNGAQKNQQGKIQENDYELR